MIRKIIYNLYHYFLSLLGAIIYLFPSRKIKIIGVTGTKGKSTTISILSSFLEAGGFKTAYISSVYLKIGDSISKNNQGNSMPGRFFIKKFISQAVRANCDFVLIEITSQGVIQHRHRFIKYDKAVFLDIHPEHIEAHGSFERYLDAKLDFFRYVAKTNQKAKFFVNKEDAHSQDFKNVVKKQEIVEFFYSDIDKLNAKIPNCLAGDFNKINLSVSWVIAKDEKISEDKIKKAIESFTGVSGRMDIVLESPFKVIVDYAHTPDSLKNLYSYLTSQKKSPESKLICLLGSAGGGRDKWKRPKMGEVASLYCDTIILTNEDPYDEDPNEIISQIKSSISKDKEVLEILDRTLAIKKSLTLAQDGDIVISTGKGSEDWIHLKKGKKIPWNEKEEFLKYLPKK